VNPKTVQIIDAQKELFQLKATGLHDGSVCGYFLYGQFFRIPG